MLVCAGVFCFAAYKLYGIWNENHQIDTENKQLETYVTTQKDDGPQYLEPDWTALKEENPNLVAWLYVPGVNFSYPVVQGTDNVYYLDHTASGNVNRIGAIFLNAAASPDFTDDNSLIYGHSVDTGGMFTDLKDYADQSFFEAHPYFYILTPNGNLRCTVFAFAKTVEGTAFYQTGFGDYGSEILEEMKTTALYTRDVDAAGQPLVTLSTCDLDYGFDSVHRLVLVGVAQPYDEPVEIEK